MNDLATSAINQALRDLSQYGSVVVNDEHIAAEVLKTAMDFAASDSAEYGIRAREYKMRRLDLNIMDTRWIVARV